MLFFVLILSIGKTAAAYTNFPLTVTGNVISMDGGNAAAPGGSTAQCIAYGSSLTGGNATTPVTAPETNNTSNYLGNSFLWWWFDNQVTLTDTSYFGVHIHSPLILGTTDSQYLVLGQTSNNSATWTYPDTVYMWYYPTVSGSNCTGTPFGYSSFTIIDATTISGSVPATCSDGLLNQDETAIDSGGVCHTHIIDFTPADDPTPISSPVTFTLNVQVDPVDVGTITGVRVTLHNIDQNVLLLSDFSPGDILLLDSVELSPGLFAYTSSPTTLADGNYRIDVQLERSYFGGFLVNPFSSINDEQSHSFVVGAPTFIGNLQNNIFEETNAITGAIGGGKTASELAATCVPLGDFDIIQCMHFLFVPDSKALNDTFNAAKDAILVRVPWGYFTRLFAMLVDPTTSGLPVVSTTFKIGPTGADTETIGFDPGDMLAGAADLVDSIHSPTDSSINFRDTFKPMIQMGVALMVLFTIIADLIGSHKHHVSVSRPKGKLS